MRRIVSVKSKDKLPPERSNFVYLVNSNFYFKTQISTSINNTNMRVSLMSVFSGIPYIYHTLHVSQISRSTFSSSFRELSNTYMALV